jgi:carbon storage regulator CsrA
LLIKKETTNLFLVLTATARQNDPVVKQTPKVHKSCRRVKARASGSPLYLFVVRRSRFWAKRLVIEPATSGVRFPLVIQKAKGGPMQMITRRVNESLVIGGEIHVTVLDICKNCVRLAISSPDTFPQYREEILCLNPAFAEDEGEFQEEQEAVESLLLQ